MKKLRKIMGVVLTMVMVLAMSIPAAAAEGKTITITPSDTVKSLEGRTFKAYQILGAEAVGDSVAYTVPGPMKAFFTDRYKLTGDEGDYSYQVAQKIQEKEKDDMYSFGKDALAAAKAKGVAGTPGEMLGSNYVISGLQAGYYIVEDATQEGGKNLGTVVSALILRTNVADETITIKAEIPDINKKIIEDGKEVDKNNASIGDKVTYVLKSKVPDMTGYKNYRFVMTDTLSKGLKYDHGNSEDKITVTIGGQTLIEGKHYTIDPGTYDAANGTTIKITFKNFIQWSGQKDEEIRVTYKALVTDAAVIGETGNPNDVILQYSNNPQKEDGGDTFPPNPTDEDPFGETPKVTVYTYVTGFEFEKVNADGKLLSGATFTLKGEGVVNVGVTQGYGFEPADEGVYYKLKDGSYTSTDPSGENVNTDKYVQPYDRYNKVDKSGPEFTTAEEQTITVTTGDDGMIKFTGLGAGEYTLTEIKSPDGYNLLKDPIKIIISWEANGSEDAKCTWSGTYGDTGTENKLNFNGETGVITGLKIENNTGVGLPDTGGIGTTIFYVVGGILVVAAVVLLFMKKGMRKED